MSVYSARLSSINGRTGVTENGERLFFIGNRTFNEGDIVYTDGRYIYGTEVKHGGSFVDEPPLCLPYLDNEKRIKRLGFNGLQKAVAMFSCKTESCVFVAGKKACYLVIDYWSYAYYYNLKTGASAKISLTELSRAYSSPLSAIVDNDGNLLTMWDTATNMNNGYSAVIYKNNKVYDYVPVLYSARTKYDWDVSYIFHLFGIPNFGHLRKDGSCQVLFITQDKCVDSFRDTSVYRKDIFLYDTKTKRKTIVDKTFIYVSTGRTSFSSSSTPFEMEVGTTKDGRSLTARYHIETVATESYYGNFKRSIQVDFGAYSRTFMDDGTKIFDFTNYNGYYINSACEHDGWIYFVTGDGLYKTNDKTCCLVSKDYSCTDWNKYRTLIHNSTVECLSVSDVMQAGRIIQKLNFE
ncbi:putative phage tail protein [Selenomonas ruminantium subsp. lactilytica TAM6421]|uniref:Putative phage tail protein n=1 Tax=Selenomonas ruminantium subsp. lactilytica (strain NBRC 103574 / TAM6421) TaxID=927704 RepID=I0GRY1_SELRL|nr:hypothetical protein [Selenomonas ruminantium]BAL83518.1 putative phage tail protein [Selenomonas ruminantium subsp. lactilytica TAM6421]